MMSAFASFVFVTALCIALGAMAATWRTYAADFTALRQKLAASNPVLELRFLTITTTVRQEDSVEWRPGFTPLAAQIQARRSQYRPVRQPGLRHAAA
ncbi:MAG: hypothetical protein ABIM50_14685 [Novosphingobium sp.]